MTLNSRKGLKNKKNKKYPVKIQENTKENKLFW